jgi:2-keto-4-pentenoate hydratase/2-oxohepta-3-ene-1,7-dioic acid hydratase in catechol pathway
MRLANVTGRLKVVVGDGAVDVETVSAGQFGSDPQGVYERFDDFRRWAESLDTATEAFDPSLCGPPAPAPRQVFAVALNYRAHAEEAGFQTPQEPVIFTKYVSSFAGPIADVILPPGSIDWEVEVVAVVGRAAYQVDAQRAWDHIAGLTVGQDLSERDMQRRGPSPQFGMAKSFPGFSPMGPALVTPDELADRDDLALGCAVNGEDVQKGRTADMIFSIPQLVAHLSSVVTLYPGDVIFTGTPSGVGMGRTPPRYLAAGDDLRSWVEGVGEIRQRFIRPPAAGY